MNGQDIDVNKSVAQFAKKKFPFDFNRCLLIYDMYELWQLISKIVVHYLKSYPLGLYVNYIFEV